MSAQTFDYSLQTFTETLFEVSKISKIQADALMEIARCELSLDGVIEMKRIAEQALIETHKIARKAEERIHQN